MDVGMIKMMAEVHRRMDAGEIKYVVLNDERLPVTNEVMEEFDLVTGQTIDSIIFSEIVKRTLAHVVAEVAIAKAKEGSMKT